MNKSFALFLCIALLVVSLSGRVFSQSQDGVIADSIVTDSAVAKDIHDDLSSLKQSRFDRPIPRVEFERANLPAVLLALSEHAGIDIVSGVREEVLVTISLRNKSWQEVLEIVCRIHGLTPIVSASYIYVMTTAEYQQMMLQDAQALQQLDQLAPLRMKIVRINNSTASAIHSSIVGLMSTRGKATVAEKTNSLILVDTQEHIAQVERVIAKLDLAIPQVMIDAKLVTVSHDETNAMGINWQTLLTSTTRGDLATVGMSAPIPDEMLNVSSAASFNLDAGNFQLGLSQVALDFFSTFRDAEVIANPQVTTLDNREAVIFMGERVPVRTLDATGRATVEMVEAGTELRVKPHITQDNRILMDLEPRKRSYIVDPQLALPVFREQSAKTSVVVDNGETIVIGGLTNREEMEVVTGIPVLRSIPFIGALFRNKRTEVRKQDLIIFVTPHIVPSHRAEDVNIQDLGDVIIEEQ